MLVFRSAGHLAMRHAATSTMHQFKVHNKCWYLGLPWTAGVKERGRERVCVGLKECLKVKVIKEGHDAKF